MTSSSMEESSTEVRTADSTAHDQSSPLEDNRSTGDQSAPDASAGAADDSTAVTTEDTSNADTLKRDYLIFLAAMTILCAGVADGLIRGFGVSPWLAVPAGIAVWGAIAQSIYRKYRSL